MDSPKFDLVGRTAIVTGGGQGIGKGICLALAQAGANIVVAELSPTVAKATAREVEALGRKCLAVRTDVCSREQIGAMVHQTLEVFGNIDILVNNAGGIGQEQSIAAMEMNESTWDDVVDLNLKSVFLCSQAVGRAMIERKKGNIVNISSVSAFMAYPLCVPYAAAKAGVISLTQSMASILGPYNIRVNAVAPGAILTEGSIKGIYGPHPELTKIRAEANPLRRLGVPEDIARVVLFLTSDASDYINGQTIRVDGGIPAMPGLTP